MINQAVVPTGPEGPGMRAYRFRRQVPQWTGDGGSAYLRANCRGTVKTLEKKPS
jgi:hypothetical protein